MKTNIVILILFAVLSCSGSESKIPTDPNTKVMICTGGHSKRYHAHKCRGLKSCKGEVRKITLAEAKRMNRTACGYCYKGSK
jgi:hypothetical protein